MPLVFRPGKPEDASDLVALYTAVADQLTRQHGKGHWSSRPTGRGVLHAMRHSRVILACDGGQLVATLRLTTRKPWAIDPTYFTPCRQPLYLHGMAIVPERQRQGIGRQLLVEAVRVAKEWPADAIRLDAYDAAAGAGRFYARCGYTEVGRVTYRGTPLIYFEQELS
jgi:GNAT superfamily N-acetyltransferase